jgi:diguanylate cyclase (GGDEF)-like protein/PAS domain S-box-containing protein
MAESALSAHPQAFRSLLWWCGILMAIVLVGGFFFVDFAGRFGESLERRALLEAVSTTAASLDGRALTGLQGRASDVERQIYRQTRASLRRMREALPLARFAYLLELRGGEVIFLADSEPADSPDHSPPGEVYTEASETMREVFATKVAAAEGPLADRWGVWVSGLAPVIDETTGEVVAVLGADISAEDWQRTVARFRWLGVGVSGFLAAVVLFFTALMYRQYRLGERLAAANLIVENSPTILYRVDRIPGTSLLPLTFVSRNAVRFGYDRDKFLAAPDSYGGLVHPDDSAAVEDLTRRLLDDDGGPATIELRLRLADGSYRWFENRLTPVRDRNGDLRSVEGMLIDIEERKEGDERARFANTLLKTITETSPDGILVVDKDARIIAYNRRFGALWGVPQEVLDSGDDAAPLAAVTASMKDPAAFLARVQHLYAHPEETGHDELETKDGRFFDRHTAVLHGNKGEYLGRVWFFRDITERKCAEAQILQAARYDGLTGLANRTVFMEAVQGAMARARRDGKAFAVLYLDLDHFKDVNDTLGHPIGDELLKAVAERLRSNVREVDTVARFGGDEFAIIAADLGEPADAAVLADAVIASLGKPFLIQGNDIRSGASVGISVFGPDEPDAEAMLSHADVALYRAKAEGRGGYRFFTEEMDVEVRTRVSLGKELREAIAKDQLFLLYQPQVEIETGRIIGVEALARWRHPERGILEPDVFIAVAERSGIIAPLGRWAMREACRQARQWLDAGIAPATMAVNLSAMQFKRPLELERDILAAISEAELPADMLELELTESILMTVSREHNDVFRRLRAAGTKLAIDDFGTGYSSLDYLRQFAADRIKIAQVFVGKIAYEPGSAAIVRATLGLARELGLSVIAEGVDSAEQLALLRSWGCREAQGFHFARPLTPAELMPLLRKGKIDPSCRTPAKSAA